MIAWGPALVMIGFLLAYAVSTPAASRYFNAHPDAKMASLYLVCLIFSVFLVLVGSMLFGLEFPW